MKVCDDRTQAASFCFVFVFKASEKGFQYAVRFMKQCPRAPSSGLGTCRRYGIRMSVLNPWKEVVLYLITDLHNLRLHLNLGTVLKCLAKCLKFSTYNLSSLSSWSWFGWQFCYQNVFSKWVRIFLCLVGNVTCDWDRKGSEGYVLGYMLGSLEARTDFALFQEVLCSAFLGLIILFKKNKNLKSTRQLLPIHFFDSLCSAWWSLLYILTSVAASCT